MLNTKPQKFNTISGGFGGIKPEDLAGAMAYAKIHDDASRYIRAKYVMCGEDQERELANGLIQAVAKECLLLKPSNENKRFRKETLDKFVNMMVRQDINPAKCMDCRGKAYDEFRRMCGSCNGTGKQQHTQVARANLSNINVSNYQRKWAQHENEITSIFQRWESLTARRLAVQLSEN